jgi:hypothetical protein
MQIWDENPRSNRNGAEPRQMYRVSHLQRYLQERLWVAKYKSGGDRSLKQTAAMWPPRVTVKRGWNS